MVAVPKPTRKAKSKKRLTAGQAGVGYWVKKPIRHYIVQALDTEMSLFCRETEPFCVICGKRENLQCGHLFSRVAYSTRWDIDNCHTQCSGCNCLHEHDAHPFTAWYVTQYSWEAYQMLYARHKKAVDWSNQELLDKLYALAAERKRYGNGRAGQICRATGILERLKPIVEPIPSSTVNESEKSKVPRRKS
jgi:hypothetical protein